MISKVKEWVIEIKELIYELIAGFSISSFGAMILPEVTHMIFVLVTGFLGTIVIHFTKKLLNDK